MGSQGGLYMQIMWLEDGSMDILPVTAISKKHRAPADDEIRQLANHQPSKVPPPHTASHSTNKGAYQQTHLDEEERDRPVVNADITPKTSKTQSGKKQRAVQPKTAKKKLKDCTKRKFEHQLIEEQVAIDATIVPGRSNLAVKKSPHPDTQSGNAVELISLGTNADRPKLFRPFLDCTPRQTNNADGLDSPLASHNMGQQLQDNLTQQLQGFNPMFNTLDWTDENSRVLSFGPLKSPVVHKVTTALTPLDAPQCSNSILDISNCSKKVNNDIEKDIDSPNNSQFSSSHSTNVASTTADEHKKTSLKNLLEAASDIELEFLSEVLEAVKNERLSKDKSRCYKRDFSSVNELREEFFRGAEGWTELAPKCGFFLPDDLWHCLLLQRIVPNDNWEDFTRQVLTEVYRDKAAYYSVCGLQGNMKIAPELITGLWRRINRDRTAENYVQRADLVEYINKILANKRNYRKRKAAAAAAAADNPPKQNAGGKENRPLNNSNK